MPHFPRALHIQPVALAPAACQRAVDKNIDAKISALGRILIGGDHVIDHRFNKRSFFEIEIRVALAGRCGCRLLLRLRHLRRQAHRRCRGYRAACNSTFEKLAPIDSVVFHGIPL